MAPRNDIGPKTRRRGRTGGKNPGGQRSSQGREPGDMPRDATPHAKPNHASTTPLAGVAALLQATDSGRVIHIGPCSPQIAGIPVMELSERDAIDLLRRGGVDVMITPELRPPLIRALHSRPCALLVLTGTPPKGGGIEPSTLAGMWLIGPHARITVGHGQVVACAHGPGELAGLIRALGNDEIRLALAPTPSWLVDALAHPALQPCPLVGTVHAAALDVRWARWAQQSPHVNVVVPVGIPDIPLERPRAPELAIAVAAQALERWTGPVFPSPRVIVATFHGLQHPDGPRTTASESTLALWQQARRALPVAGAMVGMEQPAPGLSMEAPTAAFLAQQTLLRARTRRNIVATVDRPEAAAIETDAEQGLGRAREILTTAGADLSDQESKVVLRGLGLTVTRQAVANSASGAAGFAERIGFPVVLKALSPHLRRRSEIDALALDLTNSAAVRRAYGRIVANVEVRAPTARLDGVVVAEQVEEGLDVQAGVIALGGGQMAVYARALADSLILEPTVALAPLGLPDAQLLALDVLARLPVPALRRDTDPDHRALAELLQRLSALALAFGDRLSLVDLNPVRLVGPPRGYVILDARIAQRPHLEGA